MKFNTKLLHGTGTEENPYGATVPPISQVSAFAYESAEKLEKVFNNRAPGFAYTRIANPVVDSFEKKICALEGGLGAVACASGMSAITAGLLNILQNGDEVIAGSGLFGGTIDLFGDMEAFGIRTRFAPHISVEDIEPLITENTKAVFGELIGNPGLDVMDVQRVADFLHEKGIPLIVDATTATPYLIQPFTYGADIVIHSTSKYINGGGNSISGIIIDSGNFAWDPERYPGLAEYKMYGKFAYLAKLRGGIWRNMGGCLAPMNAFMNIVGVETLGLRMERICQNAKQLAEALSKLDGVSVNYPTLPVHPYHDLAMQQFHGMGGGIVTLRAGSKERAYKVLNALKYTCNATNIGDTRTLVIHPASTTHSQLNDEELADQGIKQNTIRLSIGTENIDDIIEDLDEAFKTLQE